MEGVRSRRTASEQANANVGFAAGISSGPPAAVGRRCDFAARGSGRPGWRKQCRPLCNAITSTALACADAAAQVPWTRGRIGAWSRSVGPAGQHGTASCHGACGHHGHGWVVLAQVLLAWRARWAGSCGHLRCVSSFRTVLPGVASPSGLIHLAQPRTEREHASGVAALRKNPSQSPAEGLVDEAQRR